MCHQMKSYRLWHRIELPSGLTYPAETQAVSEALPEVSVLHPVEPVLQTQPPQNPVLQVHHLVDPSIYDDLPYELYL